MNSSSSPPSAAPDALPASIPGAGIALLGVLLLVAIAAWARVWWQRSGGRLPKTLSGKPSAERKLELQAQLRLDAFTTLYAVEWADGRKVLLAASRGQPLTRVDTAPVQDPNAAP
ncbi:MAG TPA: hypothetical protein VGM81_16460 [Burkholderiaceae bacterium]|jgi:hypothetical protein